MFRSTWCIHTFLILTLSSMTQPVLASGLFFPVFLFLLLGWSSPMAIFHFLTPIFIYFFNGVNFFKTKYRWPRTIIFWVFLDLNIRLLATFWENQVLGSEDGHSGRWYIFCSLCFQPLPDGTLFPKTMPALLFSTFDGDYQKLLFPLFFQQKAGQNSTTYGETAPTPLYNIWTYLFTLSQ